MKPRLRLRHGAVLLWLFLGVAFLGGCGEEEPEESAPENAQDDDEDNGEQENNGSENNNENADNGGDGEDDNTDESNGDEDNIDDGENNDDEEEPVPEDPGEFGDWCDDDRSCADDYSCVSDEFDGDRGVCTRGCEPLGSSCLGIPAPGTNAKCVYESAQVELEGACAFVCVLDHGDHIHSYDCPPELSCEEGGGVGQGYAYCVPAR